MLQIRIERNLICKIMVLIVSVIIAECIGLIVEHYMNIIPIFNVLIKVTLIVVMLLPFFFLFVYKPVAANAYTIECLKNDQKFRLIADFSYDWEYWEDSDKSLLYVSPSCAVITGYSPEDFFQHTDLLRKIINSEDLEKMEDYKNAVIKGCEVDPIEIRIATKSGETRWIDHVCKSVYDDNGENRGIRVSNRDITKIKLLKKEVKILKGLLPICASCKNIRDDKGYWNEIESYIRDNSEAEFSHGICPDCKKTLYPELMKDV